MKSHIPGLHHESEFLESDFEKAKFTLEEKLPIRDYLYRTNPW